MISFKPMLYERNLAEVHKKLQKKLQFCLENTWKLQHYDNGDEKKANIFLYLHISTHCGLVMS